MARSSVDDFVIDFSKEEKGGGGGLRIKDGIYHVKIVGAKPVTSSDKGTPGLELKLKFLSGPKKGKVFTETLYATRKAYSRFRALLEALGKKVPQRVDLGKIARAVKDEELWVEMGLEKKRAGYSQRSRVTFEGFFSEEDVEEGDEDDDDDEVDDDDLDDVDEEDDDEEDEEDEPEPPKKKRKAKKKAKPADDEEDDDDDLDLDEL